MTGRLIALEGVDAAGKSTQVPVLAKELGAVETFQFGATAIGSALRRILLEPPSRHFDSRAEALLIIADKAQHVAEIVRPALEAGRDVVSDRFTASAIAYQGYGRGLDVAVLRSIMGFATEGIEPNLNVLLDIDPEVALGRLGEPGSQLELFGQPFADNGAGSDRIERASDAGDGDVEVGAEPGTAPGRMEPTFDRFEAEGRHFRERVRNGYLELADADPDRWMVVDGDAPVTEVTARVLSGVQGWLEGRGR